ncbi:TPR-like protein [Lindgomyces ingoldianus]|uniref:TPR-like protein n=1 Tax=Lindgomyces ingoldianus TaxID=673940 RepID=A0ACB6R206_9PLEO|nr:TPR-like protein [Lindgomyces ingoldianus]KAF2473130.1 TPR-like protein [Lindgomyces ingoldianus]
MAYSSVTSTFGGSNYGFQAGLINGPVSVAFHLPPETPANPSSNIPFPRDPDYVDRELLLDRIYKKLSVPASKVALVGLGGVGYESNGGELSLNAYQRIGSHSYFREIADQVKIPGRVNQKANIFKLVHDWLCDKNKGNWVLVLDNVDNADFLLKPQTTSKEGLEGCLGSKSKRPLIRYLPRNENGSVLITTRSRDMALKLVEENNLITVEPMDRGQALGLLEKKLGDQMDNDRAAELGAALEYMPLAIVQAAAYIKERALRCSVQQYIEKLKQGDKAKTSLLNYDGGHLRRDWEAENSILLTWQISFDYIHATKRSAADLLSLMSFFDRQRIPEILLRSRNGTATRDESSRADGEKNEGTDSEDSMSEASVHDRFEDDILTLRNYSFISLTADTTTFEMHSLVQLATRKWLEGQGQLKRWRQQYITHLCREFPTGNYKNWTQCQALFPHAKLALVQKPEGEESLKEWALLIGSASDAEKMSIKSMKVRRRLLGTEQGETLNSMTMVALACKLGGRLEKAEELEVQVMETRKRVLREEHPDTLTSMANLASTYRNQGRLKEAEELEVQVMEISLKVLGEEHPSTLTGMANLASTYRDQGRWKEAEELQAKELEVCSRVLGEEHPDTLISMASLASTYRNQGRWKKAEELEVQVMGTIKRVLGEEHPHTLTSMANLALTYRNQGRWKEAEALGLQVMEVGKRVLGEEHPSTLTSVANLASTYRNQGRWKEAEELDVQVVETNLRVLGEEHPSTLISIANLASTFWDQGRWKEAEELQTKGLEICLRVLVGEHPDTLTSMANLALTYKSQGGWKKAEELEVQVMDTRKRVLGEEHPYTLTSMANLASTYRNQGRVLGEEHPDTLTSMANLALTLRTQDRTNEAIFLIEKCSQMRKYVLGL